MRNMQQGEQINDFAHAEPVKSRAPSNASTLDEDQWAARAHALGDLHAVPEVKNSGVELEVSEGGLHLVNSEGTEVREPGSAAVLRARAMRRRQTA